MNKVTTVILLLIVEAAMLFRVLMCCEVQQTSENCISAAAVDILSVIMAVGLVMNSVMCIIKDEE